MLLWSLVIKLKKNYRWYKLDTAANMFASIQGKTTSRVFRISYVLKDEEVNPEILKSAVKDIMKRFPSFSSRCKEGFFWAYLEHTDILPEVSEEKEMPAAVQCHSRNGGPELRVLYYKRRITVEIAHVLTDGDGAFEFTKALVAHYINLTEGTKHRDSSVISVYDEPSDEETENAYMRYSNGKAAKKEELTDSYNFSDKLDNTYVKAISGIMPVEDLKVQCKKYGVSVTEYLCAAGILASIRADKNPINKNVRISVPINIRHIFPSKTLRNFACDTTLSFNPQGKRDYTLSDILTAIKGELKKSVSKEGIQNFINETYSKTVNPVLRAVPYFIKKTVLNSSQIKTHQNGMTVIISNIGVINLPDWLSEKIERIDVVSGNGSVYGMPILSTCASVNGYLNICFSQCHESTDFCKEYFRIISSDGVRVRVETSDGNGFNEDERTEEGKRCSVCDVDLGEEYTVCPLCNSKTVAEAKKIPGFVTAEYPLSFEQPDHTPSKAKSTPLSKEKLKAYFHI